MELATRLRRCTRTTTASQITKQVCPAAHPPPRQRPAAGAATGANSPTRAIAALGPAFAARSACALEAERSDGPYGCSTPFWPCREAQGLADQGSRLSERRRREFERDPAKPEHRRLPRCAAAGSRTVGSPFFWVLFFGEAKKSTSPAGARPGLHPQQTHNINYQIKSNQINS